MATRPAFQFYPADWRNNANLRRCTEAARGAWIDVLCLLHDSDEYGVLRWPLADIAQAAGLPLKLLQELIRKSVLKGADSHAADYCWAPSHAGKVGDEVVLVAAGDGPCWYCSRFVRDEYIRQRRGANTRYSADNPPPKAQPKIAPKVGIGDDKGYGASSSSSTSVKQEQKQKKRASAPPCPDGVSEQVWTDWLALRRAKSAPVTPTVVTSATAEAAKAGMGLEAFLTIWCRRGSQGLEADWLKPNERAGPAASPQSKTLTAIQKLEGLKHGMADSGTNDRLPKTPLLGFGPDAGNGFD